MGTGYVSELVFLTNSNTCSCWFDRCSSDCSCDSDCRRDCSCDSECYCDSDYRHCDYCDCDREWDCSCDDCGDY